MNGKRAKALRRFRAKETQVRDIVRLAKTEFPGKDKAPAKPAPVRQKKRNRISPIALAARVVR